MLFIHAIIIYICLKLALINVLKAIKCTKYLNFSPRHLAIYQTDYVSSFHESIKKAKVTGKAIKEEKVWKQLYTLSYIFVFMFVCKLELFCWNHWGKNQEITKIYWQPNRLTFLFLLFLIPELVFHNASSFTFPFLWLFLYNNSFFSSWKAYFHKFIFTVFPTGL